ncbi:glutamine amidotransferase [bacterium BMS3Abin05]|nr:glutamine amidotransferase [bacterium BMS3Abin05]GBE27275.1 glutamine amidotransferase [bacterium BMS3Bbin03]HDZ13065.1 GMP synthase [Bacteroidota bacterium]
MILPILVVRHCLEENLGSWQDVFVQEKIPFTYRDIYRGESLPERLQAYSGVILLGGFMGVYEEDRYAFLKDELVWVEKVLKAQKPLLGICLGSQVIARVLGAGVYRGYTGPEIGWKPVSLTEAGRSDPVLKALPEKFVPVHWHGDTFDLPSGAALLASSERYIHQAFRYGRSTYGIQFHVEANESLIHFWLKEDTESIEKANETKTQILEDTAEHLPGLKILAKKLWTTIKPIFQS